MPPDNCRTQRRFACHPARCKMLWCAKIQRYTLMGKTQNEATEARRMDMPPLRRRARSGSHVFLAPARLRPVLVIGHLLRFNVRG